MLVNCRFENFELFSELQKDILDTVIFYLQPHMIKHQVSQKTTLLSENEAVENILLIQEGILKSVQYTPDGRELIHHIFAEGEIFGCLETVTGSRLTALIKVEKDATIISIPGRKFVELMDILSPLKDAVLKYFGMKSEYFIYHGYILKYQKARDRICLFLIQIANKRKSVTYHFSYNMETMANYLNLSRSALSKELHSLESEGFVEIKKIPSIFLILMACIMLLKDRFNTSPCLFLKIRINTPNIQR